MEERYVDVLIWDEEEDCYVLVWKYHGNSEAIKAHMEKLKRDFPNADYIYEEV